MLSRRNWLMAALGMACWPFPGRAFAGGMKIISVDLASAQTLFAMGVQLQAIAQRHVYAQVCVAPAVPDDVIDVGFPNEPNIELLIDLAPDVIIGGAGQDRLAPLFQSFASFISTRLGGDDPHHYDVAVHETLALGARLQMEDRAVQLVENSHTQIQACKSDHLNRGPIYVVTLMPDGRHAWVWGQGSLVQDVLTALGIQNAWRDPVKSWGGEVIGVERLATGNADGLVYTNGPRTPQALKNLSQSPLWTNRPFVKTGCVAQSPAFYLFGGLPAAVHCARGISAALRSMGTRHE